MKTGMINLFSLDMYIVILIRAIISTCGQQKKNGPVSPSLPHTPHAGEQDYNAAHIHVTQANQSIVLKQISYIKTKRNTKHVSWLLQGV